MTDDFPIPHTGDLNSSLDDAAAPNDGWIDWHGGEMPVPGETRVDVRFRDGWTDQSVAAVFSPRWWKHERCMRDNHIIGYRIVETSHA